MLKENKKESPISRTGIMTFGAVAALMISACGSDSNADVDANESGNTESELVHCYGINECAGTAECAGANNDCQGLNECAGQGFISVTQAECDEEGGSTEAPA